MPTDSDSYDLRLDRALLGYHRRQRAAVATEECPSAEDLLDYLEGKLAAEKVISVHDHLPYCTECRDVVLSFHSDSMEAASEPSATLQDTSERRPAGTLPAWVQLRWLPVTALAVAVTLLAIVELKLYPSKVSMLAYVDPKQSVSATRSAAYEIDPMASAFQRGVAALIDAQTWILNRVDERKVDEAIRYLKEAKSLAEKSNNHTYAGESAYYLGKAYLKKRSLSQARQSFEEALKLDDPSETLLLTKQRAAELLKAITLIE